MAEQSSPEQLVRRPGRHLSAAIAGAAAVGAVAMPGWRVGIGWPLIALAVLGVVVVARFGPTRASVWAGPDRGWRAAAGLATVALVAVAGIRAAGWLVTLCLVAATVLASYALAGGRGWRGLAYGLTALPTAAYRGLGWAAGNRATRTERAAVAERQDRLLRAGLGFAVGVALVLVFGALFRAADRTFADLLDGWAEGISVVTTARTTLGFALVAGLALGAAYLVSAPRTAENTPADDRGWRALGLTGGGRGWRVLALAEWAIPLAMLDVLFGIFVWVQVTTLFASDEYVLQPGGPDYAEYARGGFLQLAVVTLLTLGVVTVLSLWGDRATRTERALLRGLGGVLCTLTLVIVASALKRMGLYAQAYGFSVPRLLGYTGELWLGLVFVLLLVAGARLSARWLPHAVVAAGVAVLLGVAVINPEGLMARTHIERLNHHLPVDHHYLWTLSADAIAAIDALPEPGRSCVLRRIAAELRTPDPWYGLNLGRARARALIARHPVRSAEQTQACQSGSPFGG